MVIFALFAWVALGVGLLVGLLFVVCLLGLLYFITCFGMFVYLLLYACLLCGVSLYVCVLFRRWCALGWFTICCFVIVSAVIGDFVRMLFCVCGLCDLWLLL